MQFVSVETKLLSVTSDAEKLIERCGRVSHRSENKISLTSHIEFNQRMVKLGHLSVLEHASATFFIQCSRGISHEIVRHRLASYTQESTRYVKYKDLDIIDFDLTFSEMEVMKNNAETAEAAYLRLIKEGATPQIARDTLPIGLATRLYMTTNFRQWREIIQKRTDKAAHPQVRYIFDNILSDLCEEAPSCFKDLLTTS